MGSPKQNKSTGWAWIIVIIFLAVFVLTGRQSDPRKPTPSPTNVHTVPNPKGNKDVP